MKSIVNNHFTKQPQRIISALALTSILSLSTGLTLLQAAATASINQQAKKDEIRAIQLPNTVANTVRRDLSRRTGIPAEKWKITKFSRKTWPNGCLSLGRADEVCTQALVEGWQITLSDGSQNWSYRTDSEGLVLRLEPVENYGYSNLPKSVADTVLRAASKQLGLPISELRIRPGSAQQRIWSDGCLGLGARAELCLQGLVPGWLVTIEGKQKCLLYRTNASGSQIKLDGNGAGCQISLGVPVKVPPLPTVITVKSPPRLQIVKVVEILPKPVPIPKSDLNPLKEGVIFRETGSGGLAGISYETNLFSNGRVIKTYSFAFANDTNYETYQVSQEQVQQFLKVLKQQQFNQLTGLYYPTSAAVTDDIFNSLTSRDGTATYYDYAVDIGSLPSSLNAVIRAWGQLLSGMAL